MGGRLETPELYTIVHKSDLGGIMRIAVLIIGLCLTMLVGLQSCAVSLGGDVSDRTDLSEGGAVGILIAFLFVLGSAFSLALPKVSTGLFGLAALLGLLVAGTTGFRDMYFWGGVAAVLAVMSYFGVRELARKKTGAA